MNPLEIELVLVNLIRNAIQACERRAEIAVNTAWTDDLVLVSVSDNGRGMTSDQIAHMFEPMYTTRQKSGGFGFGLAIASGIVQRHHGTMNVTSRPDAGTTVTVSLPLAAPLSQEDDQSRADDHGADSHCRR
jgi:signal transduction histidine kinase